MLLVLPGSCHLSYTYPLSSPPSLHHLLLVLLLQVIEQHYTPNPYHCGTHAADVVQAVTAILLTDQLPAVLTQLEVLALVLAAAVHDVDHPGECV